MIINNNLLLLLLLLLFEVRYKPKSSRYSLTTW